MVKLEVVNINKWQYTLKDTDTKQEIMKTLTFYGLKKPLKVGDQIIMHKELLDPAYYEYSTEYIFGPIDEVYGRKVTSIADIDAIGIKQGKDIITLKRFYG